jgi:A/G-specific adenine glycosylase
MTAESPVSATRPAQPANSLAGQLLAWYDRHARTLPWRVLPDDRANGEITDPYRVWLSEIMLQQTTVQAVKPYFEAFTRRWPDVRALAEAHEEDVMKAWAGLGYYSRARNLKACAETVARDHGGVFPDTEAGLLALPGIGPYTAAAIAAIAFDRPAAVVDGNVERVISRLRAIETPLPAAKPEIRAATAELVPDDRPGDFAQATMDLGASLCSPKRPACALCPWVEACAAHLAGIAETLPKKAPKQAKPTRRGMAFVVTREDGAVLLRRRPPKGLLGGMSEPPVSDVVGRSVAGRSLRCSRTRSPPWRRHGGAPPATCATPSRISISSLPSGMLRSQGTRKPPTDTGGRRPRRWTERRFRPSCERFLPRACATDAAAAFSSCVSPASAA